MHLFFSLAFKNFQECQCHHIITHFVESDQSPNCLPCLSEDENCSPFYLDSQQDAIFSLIQIYFLQTFSVSVTACWESSCPPSSVSTMPSSSSSSASPSPSSGSFPNTTKLLDGPGIQNFTKSGFKQARLSKLQGLFKDF